MSSLLELEEPGVTLFSTVEDFGAEVETRHLHYCVTKFLFPASKKVAWILDYNLSSYTSESSYAYLSRQCDNANSLIDLSGTFSIVTHDGVAHILAIFLNHEFEKNTMKEIKLQKLDSILCEEEELFPNGNLILRCHLWQNPTGTESFEYRVRSRSLIKTYKFPLVIEAEIAEDGRKYFNKHIFETDTDFNNGKNNLLLGFNFEFNQFLSDESSARLHVTKLKEYDFDLHISQSIFVQCVDGTLISLFGNKQYFRILSFLSTLPLCISIEEFKNKGDFYYPNGKLTLVCHIKCVKVFEIEFESITHENVATVEVVPESDGPNSRTIEVPLEEDRTLKHSMYSLYEEGKFCDIALRSDTVIYPCHKVVLCSRSLIFSTMFESDMLERKNGIVDIEDVSSSTLSLFLKYMYTDKIGKLDFEDALLLFSVADKYDVTPLRKKCISILKTKITTKNSVELLICADMHQNEDLIKFSKNYVCKHAKSIINSENWKKVKTNYPGLALEIQDQLIGKIFFEP